eukprot:254902-Pyramimonas_sp.AAC.1
MCIRDRLIGKHVQAHAQLHAHTYTPSHTHTHWNHRECYVRAHVLELVVGVEQSCRLDYAQTPLTWWPELAPTGAGTRLHGATEGFETLLEAFAEADRANKMLREAPRNGQGSRSSSGEGTARLPKTPR